jgi:hypothetical protein
MNIYELGYNQHIIKTTSLNDENQEMKNSFSDGLAANIILSGSLQGNFEMVDGHMQSSNYSAGTSGWIIRHDGFAQFSDIDLTGGTLKYQKTSFTDDTKTGYYIGSEGIYLGSVSDATKLKFTISNGLLDLVGTISGRDTDTIKDAINTDGNLITDIINTKLDTDSEQILAGFTFGASGAIQIGTYEEGVSGDIKISPAGIVGRNEDGDETFTISGTTGDATFAGQLSAAAGTLGEITITAGGNIKQGQTNYATGTGFFLGSSGGEYKLSVGGTNNYLRWDGSYLVLKGSFDVGSEGIINNATYTVANLPIAATSVGFEVPSAYE